MYISEAIMFSKKASDLKISVFFLLQEKFSVITFGRNRELVVVLERWRFGVFIVNFEQMSNIFLVFLTQTFSK